MSDYEKWTWSVDVSRSSRDLRLKRTAAHIATCLVSKSEFLGKSRPRCASRFPRISSRITSRRRVESHRAFRRGDSPMDEGNLFATAWFCHREKCRLFFSDCDKRAPSRGYAWRRHTRGCLHFLVNERSRSFTRTPTTVGVGQPADKLMSRVSNWKETAQTK